MQLKMWMYDLAREQAPTLDHLFQIASITQEAGFDTLGIYLEHRFAYPSAPWAHGIGCVTPQMIRRVREEFPSLKLIPFVNLLGHFEGMIYTEEGKQYREAMLEGLQACASNPDFVALCERLIDDVLEAFDSEIIHIGGDETAQLGQCGICKDRVEKAVGDGKAQLYGLHFGPLAHRVLAAGRTPAVWGDMFDDHLTALDFLPRETLIFDWQYFNGVRESSAKFTEKGFRVVGCPAIQTYNATWCHVSASEKNVIEIAQDVEDLGLHGVCVTTWECGLMGAYDTLFPILMGCGKVLNGAREEGIFLEQFEGDWAKMMSEGLAEFGGTFAPGKIRSSLKVRLLLQANPFLAWMHHGEEFSGDHGKKILDFLDQTLFRAPGEAEKGVTIFARAAVEFVRMAEAARIEYKAGRTEAAIAALAPTRKLFDDLAQIARKTNVRIGGSLADIERCRIAKEHVERVIANIKRFGNGSLGYLPAFEIITHPKFCPHDQASWWLINKWANQ